MRLGLGVTIAAFAALLEAAPAAAQPGARIVRFDATLEASVKARDADGHFRPSGFVTPGPGADAWLNPGRPAAYASVVDSNVDGKGGFTDKAAITFGGGELRLQGVYPTHNEPTVIEGVLNTVMVEKVVGGTGVFEGATGYVMLNSTLERGGAIHGSMNAIVFLAPGDVSRR